MSGKKTVSKTAEHLAEHLMHHGGFISKGLNALVEEAVRIRTKALLQELKWKIRVSNQRVWERRVEWDNEWKL